MASFRSQRQRGAGRRMNNNTPLHRQVHPNWAVAGGVSSQAFMPTRKDQGLLSTYNGDMISPLDSFEHYTTTLGLRSAGVVDVTVGECRELQLPVYQDPQPDFDEHTVIDGQVPGRGVRVRHPDCTAQAAADCVSGASCSASCFVVTPGVR